MNLAAFRGENSKSYKGVTFVLSKRENNVISIESYEVLSLLFSFYFFALECLL
jgi:hypothetical protein